MVKPKEQIGTYKCWSCGHEVPVKKLSGSGKLAAPCAWCDWANHYADPDTKHFKNLMAATTLDKPAADPDPAPPPAPARARSSNPMNPGAR